jgi:hypothetical protein
MRNSVFLRFIGLAIVAASVGLVGCSDDGSGDGGGTVKGNDPVFQDGQGQSPNATVAYAPGPYGISKGSIIENFQFIGFANASVNSSGMQAIQLADFYNPTGTDVYPEGSQYGAGTPKPKALLIDVASVWCGPCNQEADTVLPGKYANYKPQGGEFLLQLADGQTPGTAATSKNLYNWVTKYEVNYPGTIDPSYKLGALFDQDAFPANFIIKTQNMEIIESFAGVPDAAFWSKFQKVLNGEL